MIGASRQMSKDALTTILIASAVFLASTFAPSAGEAAVAKRDRPQLIIAGKLADYDKRPLTSSRAGATILASDVAGSGIARIEIEVDGRKAAVHGFHCNPSCPPWARTQFTYQQGKYGGGSHAVTVTATTGAGRSVERTIGVEPRPSAGGAAQAPQSSPAIYLPASNAAGLPNGTITHVAGAAITALAAIRHTIGAAGPGPPDAQPALYVTAASPHDLTRQVATDTIRFARSQGPGPSLLIFDFGAARHKGGRWGTSLRSGTFFTNGQIASALQTAAHVYSQHYEQGDVTFVYGTSNSNLGTDQGAYKPLNAKTAREAGKRQAAAVASLHLYAHESAAPGGDIEPGYPNTVPPKVSIALVRGASAQGTPYYNVGTANCTGSRCVNGWSVRDICAVSTGGARFSLPEIYYHTPTDQSEQWAAVRERCGIKVFAGASASLLGHYSPSEAWQLLNQRAHVGVGPVIVVWPE
jgi:hypothetical protein